MFYGHLVKEIRDVLVAQGINVIDCREDDIDNIRVHRGYQSYKIRVGNYLAWMCDQLEIWETNSFESALKAARWIGWMMAMTEETYNCSNSSFRQCTREDVRMGFHLSHRRPVLGLDFGRTICDIGAGHITTGRAEVDPKFFDLPFIDGAVETIKGLVPLFGPRSIHIVSKCAPESEELIKEWLTRKNFWQLTGLRPENIHFCRERHEKAAICERLGITHFVDDRREVLAPMRDMWMRIALNPRDDDPDEAPFVNEPFRPTVAEQHRGRILVAADWAQVGEFIKNSFIRHADPPLVAQV